MMFITLLRKLIRSIATWQDRVCSRYSWRQNRKSSNWSKKPRPNMAGRWTVIKALKTSLNKTEHISPATLFLTSSSSSRPRPYQTYIIPWTINTSSQKAWGAYTRRWSKTQKEWSTISKSQSTPNNLFCSLKPSTDRGEVWLSHHRGGRRKYTTWKHNCKLCWSTRLRRAIVRSRGLIMWYSTLKRNTTHMVQWPQISPQRRRIPFTSTTTPVVTSKSRLSDWPRKRYLAPTRRGSWSTVPWKAGRSTRCCSQKQKR